MKTNKAVLVNEPHYGICWLDVDRVIALVPEKRWLLFEGVRWELDEHDFKKVSDVWHQLKGTYYDRK